MCQKYVATYNSYLSVYYIRGSKDKILIDLHNLYMLFEELFSRFQNNSYCYKNMSLQNCGSHFEKQMAVIADCWQIINIL